MGEKELREKYGGKLAKALNRAIRAECPEGNNALDRLTKLAGQASKSGWTLPSGQKTEEAAAYEKHQRQLVSRLEAEVRARWGIPPEVVATPASKKPTGMKKGPRKTGPRKSGPPKPRRNP